MSSLNFFSGLLNLIGMSTSSGLFFKTPVFENIGLIVQTYSWLTLKSREFRSIKLLMLGF
jgi:hypothetical protein